MSKKQSSVQNHQLAHSNQLRFTRRILLAVCCAFYLSAIIPALAQTPDKPAPVPKTEEAVPPPKKEVVVQPRAGDEQIARRLKEILGATGWFRRPEVKVREGVVFLDGEAQEQAHQKWAGDLAQSTQDVVAVVNRIEISREVRWNFEAAKEQVELIYWEIARSLPNLFLAIIILLLSWVGACAVAVSSRYLLARRISSPLLLDVVARATAIPVFLLGLYFVLLISDLTRLALTVLGGTGLAGLILGFAFRDIGENFLASLFLSMRNPFKTGDYISVDGTEGIVQNLNTRTTVLLTLDGNHVQIPNATVFKNEITNYSTNPYRRSEYVVAIGNDASITQAQNIILAMLSEHAAVLEEPEPLVLVNELGSSAINLRVLYWFDSSIYSPIKIRSAILRLTRRALLGGGISMADDRQEVTFPDGVPLVQSGSTAPEPIAQTGQRADFMGGSPETGEGVTRAEGDLMSEQGDVKVKTDLSRKEDDDDNLLLERKPL